MKCLVIAAYMGDLPALMPLWLRSASCNPDIDFLVVSDRSWTAPLPANVRFKHATLADLAAVWSEAAGFPVALDSPYKINDFKPLIWMLADNLEAYDYWGFCDLDVIFGDLSVLTAGRLGRYDMIASEGHFRLVRNTPDCRDAWREIDYPRTWQDVLSDPANFGMDEHHGFNGVFARGTRSWFTDPGRVADIDPAFRQMRRMARLPNHECQAFYWDEGRIYREYWADGRYGRDQYAYIHLQKRKQPIDPLCLTAPAINIDPQGIAPRSVGDDQPAALARRNPWHLPTLGEARIQLREWVRARRGIEHVIHPVDRPPAQD